MWHRISLGALGFNPDPTLAGSVTLRKYLDFSKFQVPAFSNKGTKSTHFTEL